MVNDGVRPEIGVAVPAVSRRPARLCAERRDQRSMGQRGHSSEDRVYGHYRHVLGVHQTRSLMILSDMDPQNPQNHLLKVLKARFQPERSTLSMYSILGLP